MFSNSVYRIIHHMHVLINHSPNSGTQAVSSSLLQTTLQDRESLSRLPHRITGRVASSGLSPRHKEALWVVGTLPCSQLRLQKCLPSPALVLLARQPCSCNRAQFFCLAWHRLEGRGWGTTLDQNRWYCITASAILNSLFYGSFPICIPGQSSPCYLGPPKWLFLTCYNLWA